MRSVSAHSAIAGVYDVILRFLRWLLYRSFPLEIYDPDICTICSVFEVANDVVAIICI